jgi:hypothetical protein
MAAVAGAAESAAAQPAGPRAPVATRASMLGGYVLGVVKDDAGRAIGGASVIALGPTSALARTDTQGRFTLSLLPGEYILRASHDLYISTYREPVLIDSSARVEREITLWRPGSASDASGVTAAMAKAGQSAPGEAGREHSHSEAAWRLRHLVRTVLRDEASSGFTPENAIATPGAAGAAPPVLDGIDFSGQVNFLTSSTLGGSAGWTPDQLPRGIAYLAVGAPAGDVGDWRMRAAFSGGQGGAAAWVLLGELAGDARAKHAYRVGVSYGAQGFEAEETRPWYGAAAPSRSVAGVYAFDRWEALPGVVLDYGVRLDRYDYLADPELVSPTVGGRVTVLPRTVVTSRFSRRLVAPGADEFLPPPASGPWMPPERTFSSLIGRAPIRAEDVRHLEIGVEHALGPSGDRTTLAARRFRQSTFDQAATIFGLDASSGRGHYYVATPGSVEIDGWSLGVRQQFRDRVQAGFSYAVIHASWDPHRQARVLRHVAPSAVRLGDERLHDLTATLDADIPETLTRLAVAVRTNSAFARDDAGALPMLDSRFEVEVHQALPYQPIPGGRLELLFAVRTLSRDSRNPGSIYDEVLTVAPPLRLVGGFQVRF